MTTPSWRMRYGMKIQEDIIRDSGGHNKIQEDIIRDSGVYNAKDFNENSGLSNLLRWSHALRSDQILNKAPTLNNYK